MLTKIFNWILSLFWGSKSETPKLDKDIEDTKNKIKDIDEKLEDEITTEQGAMNEYKK
jgi:hypothetical protein